MFLIIRYGVGSSLHDTTTGNCGGMDIGGESTFDVHSKAHLRVYNLNKCLRLCRDIDCSRRDHESCVLGFLQVLLIKKACITLTYLIV